ncbi:MAG: NADPH-dependent oxidoreductase [Gordonia sp.]|jgi:nitroreductase|uniref:NADPH-dependent oxidoreductase n=1 Tax=Gordonia sp. (in: high G+C Gram-positive bacteria) TaxID=84139 RepID=UPI001D781711|nr:NADPH-dependent oxidoreductase [Gordonia sp. (in: high G+C Gram-positive bacteria)]MCB1296352.1 NADPH-dependent oxidoreductase [Gordonia sp. (in: high G+C Gram-positive bacteria)]HQV17915.1 NADPH-dependent oxidoreductase [Gordonia sp. (in: high G+C Gram-positive bacteria)]
MTIAARYADAALTLTTTSDIIAAQLAHRSVRKFLDTPVDDAQLQAIVAAAQSASTSSNLQPWSVIAVRDPQRKARLAALANNQQFINEAGLFLVWVADLGRARRVAERENAPLDGADYLETTIIGFVDTALAAQNAVVASESLGLGTVFVGALRNKPLEVADELGLPPHTIATFGLAVGVPDPTENAGIKPRLPQEAVLHQEQYDAAAADAHITGYDESLADYNRRHGLDGTWSGRVLTRLGTVASLHGREKLRDQLETRGLPSR